MRISRKIDLDNVSIRQQGILLQGNTSLADTGTQDLSGGTISGYQYRGTAGNDTIDASDLGTAFPAVTEVRGLAGTDIIYAPTDTTIDIIGTETGNPDTEHDIISYELFTSGVVLTTSATYIAGQKTGYFLAEQLRGSSFGDSITLRPSSPISVVDGAGGDDVIVASTNATNQTIYGGAGNDIIAAGGQGYYTVDGGTGTNALTVALHSTQTLGATITLNNTGGGSVAYNGGLGSSLSFANFQTVTGTGLDDTIIGSAGNDRINGGKGNDYLDGRGGDDLLDGGAGNDTLTFAYEAQGITLNLTNYFVDVLDPNHQYYPVGFNGHGQDGFYTYQNASGTYVSTFFNMEAYVGSQFDDRLFGGWSNDTIDGGAGNDFFRAGIGDDVMIGGDGNDLIFAGLGNDTLYGGNNNDYVNGGASGDDFLYGGNGDDVIEDYSGLNIMTGGIGHDIFVFDSLIRAAAQPTLFGYNEVHDALNIITDFHVGNTATDTNADILDLSPLLINLFYQATSLPPLDPSITGSTNLTNITGFDYVSDPNGTTLGQYVRMIQVNGAGDYHLQINVDPSKAYAQYEGLSGGWTDAAILQGTAGTSLTLDQLLANHEILFAPHQEQSQAHSGTLADYPYIVGDPTIAPYYYPTLPVPNHG
ncbi:MAG TPA: calcium-binding protein [Dongiaceae bacterium]|nr:calcium-binding protein [Dongiaceae bacterium]